MNWNEQFDFIGWLREKLSKTAIPWAIFFEKFLAIRKLRKYIDIIYDNRNLFESWNWSDHNCIFVKLGSLLLMIGEDNRWLVNKIMSGSHTITQVYRIYPPNAKVNVRFDGIRVENGSAEPIDLDRKSRWWNELEERCGEAVKKTEQ